MNKKQIYTIWSLLFILNLSGFKLVAQNYRPMLESPGEWQVTSCSGGCITDAYFTDGDTIFNGITYTVLNGYHYISRTFWLREDTDNSTVFLSYFHPMRGREEVLLYNFGLAIGDTFDIRNPLTPFLASDGNFTVDSIVPVILLDGQTYRSYYLSAIAGNPSVEKPVWIESIGSKSIINAAGGTPNINGVGELSCYFKNGELNYSQLDSISSCMARTTLDLTEKQMRMFKLFPTSSSDFITIIGIDELESLEIINSLGQLQFRQKLEFSDKLDIRNYPGGVYLVRLMSKSGEFFVKRFVRE